jgi:hypothetical protein
MKNAAIYSASPQKLTESALKSIPSLLAVTSDSGVLKKPSRFDLEFNNVAFRLNVMPKAELADHLKGFQGYAKSCHEEDPIPNLDEVVSYIGNMTQVYALVTDQEFDFDSELWSELKKVTDVVDGVIFICDSLVDTQDLVIFGPLGRTD